MKLVKILLDINYYWISSTYVGFVSSKDSYGKSMVSLISDLSESIDVGKIDFSYGRPIRDQNYFYLFSSSGSLLKINHITSEIENIRVFDSGVVGDRHEHTGFYIHMDRHVFDPTNTPSNPLTKELYCIDKFKWTNKEFGWIKIYDLDVVILFTDPNLNNNNTNMFSLLNFESGISEWAIDLSKSSKTISKYTNLSEVIKIDKFKYKYDNSLVFALNNGGIISIYSDSGVLNEEFLKLNKIDKFIANNVSNITHLPFGEDSFIIVKERKIVCFKSWYYWEIDLDTYKLELYYLRPYLENVQCYNYQQWKPIIIENDNIIIVSQLTRKFASFNRQTREYDWIIDLPENCGRPRAIEKHGNRFYIDTFNKELLVYEMD